MKKRLKTILALTASVALVGIVLSFLWPKSYLVARKQYELIDVGMSRADVENLLGGPLRNCLNNPAMVWVPQTDSKVVSARINPGTPAVRFFPNASTADDLQVVWLTDSGPIAAFFGQDGRLQEKYFSTVHNMGGPSGIERLWSRPSKGRPAPQGASQTP